MMHPKSFLGLALVAGLIVAASPAAAQTDREGTPSAADSGRRLMRDPVTRLMERREQLKLTDDQVRRLEEIRAKYRERYEGRKEELRRSREARSALRASMDSARAEIAAVLTPEQQKQVKAMRAELKKEWGKKHRERHGHGGPHGRHGDHDGDDGDDAS
jgi:Spy/CpxP family protein refolding chaperone